MEKIHTTPQILEAANFALLRAMVITLENKGLLSTGDIRTLGALSVSMCSQFRNEDPVSSLGAAQLLESWFAETFD